MIKKRIDDLLTRNNMFDSIVEFEDYLIELMVSIGYKFENLQKALYNDEYTVTASKSNYPRVTYQFRIAYHKSKLGVYSISEIVKIESEVLYETI